MRIQFFSIFLFFFFSFFFLFLFIFFLVLIFLIFFLFLFFLFSFFFSFFFFLVFPLIFLIFLELVIGSSSCDVSDFLKGSECALENQTDFHVCARAYARQHQNNQINFVEGQGHLMDRISSWSFSRSRVQFVGGKFAKEM